MELLSINVCVCATDVTTNYSCYYGYEVTGVNLSNKGLANLDVETLLKSTSLENIVVQNNALQLIPLQVCQMTTLYTLTL